MRPVLHNAAVEELVLGIPSSAWHVIGLCALCFTVRPVPKTANTGKRVCSADTCSLNYYSCGLSDPPPASAPFNLLTASFLLTARAPAGFGAAAASVG